MSIMSDAYTLRDSCETPASVSLDELTSLMGHRQGATVFDCLLRPVARR